MLDKALGPQVEIYISYGIAGCSSALICSCILPESRRGFVGNSLSGGLFSPPVAPGMSLLGVIAIKMADTKLKWDAQGCDSRIVRKPIGLSIHRIGPAGSFKGEQICLKKCCQRAVLARCC